MTEPAEDTGKPSRRRDQSRAAILEATRQELVERGWRKFSVDQVAREAKASKQTIYRWWPAIANMCVEAGLGLLPARTVMGRDPVERISDLLQPVEQVAKTSFGHSVLRGAYLAACDDSAAGETLRAWLREEIRGPLRLILAEIAAKKIIRRNFDLDTAMDILMGPLWNRLLVLRSPLPEQFGRTQAEKLLKMLAPA